jgi:ATP-dependent Clp protease ATP-binding subunit ClpA
MFERFSRDLRMTVIAAANAVRRGDDRQVEPAHLLLAVLERDGRGAALLRQAGIDVVADERGTDELRAELLAVRRRAGLSEADTSALRELGIDVDTVVANVERALGEGALDRQRKPRGPFAGLFSAEAKQALTLTLRQARSLGADTLEEVHLLLALLVQPGAVQDVLAARGIGYADVRRLADRAA